MKRKKFKKIILSVLFLAGLGAFTFQADAAGQHVRFTNTGAMNVDTVGVMFVQGDMLMTNVTGTTRDVEVALHGDAHLTGNFFHDAEGNVFVTINENWDNRRLPRGITSSIGTLHFTGNNTSGTRQISTLFERVSNKYILAKS